MNRLMRKGIGTLALTALTLMTGDAAYVSNDAAKKWTSDGISGAGVDYGTDETYTDANGDTENYRMQWELYEGSISLV